MFGCGRLTSKGVTKATSKLKNLKVIKKPDFDVLGEALGMDVEIDLEWLNKLFEEYDGVEHNG